MCPTGALKAIITPPPSLVIAVVTVHPVIAIVGHASGIGEAFI
jgi:hypothetical protein